MTKNTKPWYQTQPWKAICIIVLLIITPASGGASILLLCGIYYDDLFRRIF